MNPQAQAGLEDLDPLILATLQANLGDNSATSGTQAPDGLEDDRKAICNHPLFPILAMIFEKCEVSISTKASAFSEARGHLKAESIKQEIAKFAKQTKETTPHYIANEALDSLMVQGIQVLRFHLLELEKVHKLADNFIDRYISCLRGKEPIEPRDSESESESEDQEEEDPRDPRRADDPKLQLEEVNKEYEFMEFLEIIDVPHVKGDLDLKPPEDSNGSENPANVETPANTVILDDAKQKEFLQVLHKL